MINARRRKYDAFHRFNRTRRRMGLPTIKLRQWERLMLAESVAIDARLRALIFKQVVYR